MEEIDPPEDSTIWQNNFLPDRDEAAENVDTTVHRSEYRGVEFLIKRRDPDSERQMLTHVVVCDDEIWGDDTGERCILKYAGRRFDDAEIRQVIRAYVAGRRHQADKFRKTRGG